MKNNQTDKPGSRFEDLIANEKFDQAIPLLERKIEEDPENFDLRRTLADVYVMNGSTPEAVDTLTALADELVDQGKVPQSIAVVKEIDRIDPGRTDLDTKLAANIMDREPGRQRLHGLYRDAGQLTDDDGDFVVSTSKTITETRVPRLENEEPVLEAERTGSFIVGTPLFGSFSQDELLAIIRGMRLVRFTPGDMIVGEGEPGHSMFVLTSGTVKTFIRGVDGRYAKVREMHDGDCFGEIAIMTGQPRTATVTAATPCELLELDRNTLDIITGAHPNVWHILEDFAYSRAEAQPEQFETGAGNPVQSVKSPKPR